MFSPNVNDVWCPGCQQPHICGLSDSTRSHVQRPYYTIQQCPICEGRGNVPNGFYSRLGGGRSTLNETCETCDGKGILKVSVMGTVEKVT